MISWLKRRVSPSFFISPVFPILLSLFIFTGCGRGSEGPISVSSQTPDGQPVTETMESIGPEDDEAQLAPALEEDPDALAGPGPVIMQAEATGGFLLPQFNAKWGLARSVYDRAVAQMGRRSKDFQNRRFVVLIDFSKHSSIRRFFLFDLKTGRVEKHNVAHGVGSDPQATGYAKQFSNQPNSLKSSLGVYRTLSTYQGKHGLQLRIDGLEATNSNALSRAVVVHAAKYVKDGGGAGRSWGCPALDPAVNSSVIERIRGGAMLMIGK